MEADHSSREVFTGLGKFLQGGPHFFFFDLLFELSIDIVQISVVTNLRFNVYFYYKPIFVNSISIRELFMLDSFNIQAIYII